MDTTATSPRPMVATSPALATSARSPRSDGSLVAPDAAPDAVLEEIRTHLGEGRYRSAQRLAAEAGARFPDHPGLGTLNHGLNEWRVSTQPANGHNRTEEFAWLRNPPESARGKLVALVGSEMVAAADTMAELTALLKPMNLSKIPLVHRIDS